jgi:hypothetical protein
MLPVSVGVWNPPVFATAMVAAKATTRNAVRQAFIVVSFMDQMFANRIDLATIAAFEETLCEANHVKPAPGGTKMSRRARTAAVRPRARRRGSESI